MYAAFACLVFAGGGALSEHYYPAAPALAHFSYVWAIVMAILLGREREATQK
jgi:hypothetical protein